MAVTGAVLSNDPGTQAMPVAGRVVEAMPLELAPGAVGQPQPAHAMHPMHPPCGPGPSYAAPGNFLLSIESAKDLYDVDAEQKTHEDWTGKMDPYVIVRSGGRELRTAVMTNAGRKPKFNWAQMISWHGEPDIHFIVMDSNFLVADGLIGEAVYKGLPLQSDFKGLEGVKGQKTTENNLWRDYFQIYQVHET
eukprot:Skav224551  [mRNA]  locus=scaffold2085:70398:71104:+ [translate_table: standard]